MQAAPEPNEVNPDAFTHLACGFCLDYSKAYEMFQTVCRRSPRTARNVASEITPLVTFPVDSCRFWMVVVDIKVCFQKKTYFVPRCPARTGKARDDQSNGKV